MLESNETIELSPAGVRRREAILADLRSRAAQRRAGRAVLVSAGATACLLALGLGAMMILQHSPVPPPPDRLANQTRHVAPARHDSPPHKDPVPAPSLAVRIMVVTNEPIPDRPCDAAPSDGSICVLSDAQLLRALGETGESYGLVRVGGRTTVVSNSTAR